MPTVKVLNMQGQDVGSVELSEAVFGAEVNVSAMHTVVRAILNAKRQGTQSAKTRTEVRGGGRKIYRQKGTGNARHHGRRAPQFTHGGMVFAVKPRSYRMSVPRKVRRLAMVSALTSKAVELMAEERDFMKRCYARLRTELGDDELRRAVDIMQKVTAVLQEEREKNS